jgi:hypothetical protein
MIVYCVYPRTVRRILFNTETQSVIAYGRFDNDPKSIRVRNSIYVEETNKSVQYVMYPANVRKIF